MISLFYIIFTYYMFFDHPPVFHISSFPYYYSSTYSNFVFISGYKIIFVRFSCNFIFYIIFIYYLFSVHPYFFHISSFLCYHSSTYCNLYSFLVTLLLLLTIIIIITTAPLTHPLFVIFSSHFRTNNIPRVFSSASRC